MLYRLQINIQGDARTRSGWRTYGLSPRSTAFSVSRFANLTAVGRLDPPPQIIGRRGPAAKTPFTLDAPITGVEVVEGPGVDLRDNHIEKTPYPPCAAGSGPVSQRRAMRSDNWCRENRVNKSDYSAVQRK